MQELERSATSCRLHFIRSLKRQQGSSLSVINIVKSVAVCLARAMLESITNIIVVLSRLHIYDIRFGSHIIFLNMCYALRKMSRLLIF